MVDSLNVWFVNQLTPNKCLKSCYCYDTFEDDLSLHDPEGHFCFTEVTFDKFSDQKWYLSSIWAIRKHFWPLFQGSTKIWTEKKTWQFIFVFVGNDLELLATRSNQKQTGCTQLKSSLFCHAFSANLKKKHKKMFFRCVFGL